MITNLEPLQLLENLRESTILSTVNWKKSVKKTEIYGALESGSITMGIVRKSRDKSQKEIYIKQRDSDGIIVAEWTSQERPEIRNRIFDLFSNAAKSIVTDVIQNVRMTDTSEIDLSNLELTSFPEIIGQLTQLQYLDLSGNQITELPDTLGQLTQLQYLDLSGNQITELPDTLGQLTQLEYLDLSANQLSLLPEIIGQLTNLTHFGGTKNQLSTLPDSISQLVKLDTFAFGGNNLTELPSWISKFTELRELYFWGHKLEFIPNWVGILTKLSILDISNNRLSDLPHSITQLEHLKKLNLDNNPLNPELTEAYKQGLDAIRAYLRAKAEAQITLNEAKLILVGEGEVGKTCLMDALLSNPWQEHPTTHGIEIQQVKVTDIETKKEITLNGWDFGGQRVYRPTHQLFFSAPAVYLVVWKPREGPQQGFVKEWIQLVKRREPTAKILVVATHGGPQQRQPDIDRQELWDLFGRETVIDFFWVDSKPDANGQRKGIEELKQAIARVTVGLPEVGRSVPKSFQEVREALYDRHVPYLPLDDVFDICREHKMDDEITHLFINISHRLGHLTYYQNDPTLRDIVILRPDWLATAMSYVLDDGETRKAHGLVKFSHLSELWNDPSRPQETRYPEKLHRIFLRLMERFDLSYRVVGLSSIDISDSVSLIAQLVPDIRPEKDLEKTWPLDISVGDTQQVQICRISDSQNGQSASAEGLFYQLIVRLHKYSLGRIHYTESVHWQRGLVLDDDYNGRALLEHIGNDVRITVRAPYPERFLAMLTSEVKYLVESFWEGLQCDVMVPCLNPIPCNGLFEVGKLIENKKRGRPEQPCPVCNEWQSIDSLLLNAPSAQADAIATLFAEFVEVKEELIKVHQQLIAQDTTPIWRFGRLNDRTRRMLSRVDKTYTDLLQALTDEAKEGPRLFSFEPINRTAFQLNQWTSAKFLLTLWCEHSKLPLPMLNGKDSKKGVYEIELSRAWFKKAAPMLRVITGTLSLVLPVASSGFKLATDSTFYGAIEDQLDFGKEIIDASLGGSEEVGEWMGKGNSPDLAHDEFIRAHETTLRELQTWLKTKDPSFGGLIRVQNKRNEFLWVHEQFASEY